MHMRVLHAPGRRALASGLNRALLERGESVLYIPVSGRAGGWSAAAHRDVVAASAAAGAGKWTRQRPVKQASMGF